MRVARLLLGDSSVGRFDVLIQIIISRKINVLSVTRKQPANGIFSADGGRIVGSCRIARPAAGSARRTGRARTAIAADERLPPRSGPASSEPGAAASDSSRHTLRAAQAAAAEEGLGFAGKLSASAAAAVVMAEVGRLIDVRADVELDLEGHVPGSTHVPWLIAPDFDINPEFVAELEAKAGKDEVLVFHCRRGSRSAPAAAAAARAGFRSAFSVDGGFDELLALCVDRSTTTW